MNYDITIIEIDDPLYPLQLKHIADPPKQLYIRGNVELLSQKNLLAVVGSRKANTYGKTCVDRLLPPAVRAGVVLVSGLAFGIDSLAHKTSVAFKQPTIAVLGTGIDDASIYPRNHKNLADEILEYGGALVSEYPPQTPAYPSNFPARNRIIAGLCPATLVIQASERSGSLITARLALESNRDVLAIPGPIHDELSAGTNRLLHDGAHVVLDAADILDHYDLHSKEVSPSLFATIFTPEQKKIVRVLSVDPLHVDDITASTNLPVQQVSALLTELELLDVATHVGGMKYIRKGDELRGTSHE